MAPHQELNQETRAFLGMLAVGLGLIGAIRRGPCGATDGARLVGDGPDDLREPYGRCNLPAGHDGDWHQEWRNRKLWAEWRGPHPGYRCGICGRDGGEH